MKYQSTSKASWMRHSFLFGVLLIVSAQMASAGDNPVADVQRALKEKHFYFGDVDGSWDDATQAALRRFQFRNGLPGTGEMDAATLQTLAGNPAPAPKSIAAKAAAAPPDRDLELVRQIQRDVDRIAMRTDPNTGQKRKLSANLDKREQRIVPNVAYTDRISSWNDTQRGVAVGAVEVRRAIPIDSASRGDYRRISSNDESVSDDAREPQSAGDRPVSSTPWFHPFPRAIPADSADSTDSSQTPAEGRANFIAHFTGMDGHVYTYYKKTRPMAQYASKPQASPFGAAETSASAPPQIPDWQRSASGAWRIVDGR